MLVCPPLQASERLVLDTPVGVVRQSNNWPIRFTVITNRQTWQTCRPNDWTSRIVWQISRVGAGAMPLKPIVAVQSPDVLTPVMLSAKRPMTFTVNLRQMSPDQLSSWPAGTYRISAKLALCDEKMATTWLQAETPVFLDIVGSD